VRQQLLDNEQWQVSAPCSLTGKPIPPPQCHSPSVARSPYTHTHTHIHIHTHTPILLDNVNQTKVHRIAASNVHLREMVDDLLMDRDDLSNTIGLLKTELTGR
jgi:hypothetical protein